MILQEIWSGESLKTERSLNLLGCYLRVLLVTLFSLLSFKLLEEIGLWRRSSCIQQSQTPLAYSGEGGTLGAGPGRAGTWPVTAEELRLLWDEKLDLPAPSLPTCHRAHENHLSQAPAPGWLRRSRHSAEDVLNHECVHFSLAPGQVAPSQFCFQGWAFL